MGGLWFFAKPMTVSYCLAVSLAAVMDCFFYEGGKVLFQLALVIMAKNSEFLLHCADDGEAMMKLSRSEQQNLFRYYFIFMIPFINCIYIGSQYFILYFTQILTDRR